MKVLKFGGSSVGSAETIEKVTAIICEAAATGECAVVLSAMQGTTDALIEAGRSAERGDDGYIELLSQIGDAHAETIRKLFGDDRTNAVADFVDETLRELENLCEGVRLVRELTPKTLDRILSFGEIVSSRIVAEKLSRQGVPNEWIDSRRELVAEVFFGFAAPRIGGG